MEIRYHIRTDPKLLAYHFAKFVWSSREYGSAEGHQISQSLAEPGPQSPLKPGPNLSNARQIVKGTYPFVASGVHV